MLSTIAHRLPIFSILTYPYILFGLGFGMYKYMGVRLVDDETPDDVW